MEDAPELSIKGSRETNGGRRELSSEIDQTVMSVLMYSVIHLSTLLCFVGVAIGFYSLSKNHARHLIEDLHI